MKRDGFRVVNWALWSPAAAVMRKLRFPGKMGLMSAVFLLPVVWLLSQFLANEREDLALVALERDGVRYARAVYPALQAADQ